MDGRCEYPGTPPPDDNGNDDLALSTSSDAGAADDLSSAPPPHDLSSPSADLRMCVAPGGSCNYHNDKACCSGYCIYSTEKCM